MIDLSWPTGWAVLMRDLLIPGACVVFAILAAAAVLATEEA